MDNQNHCINLSYIKHTFLKKWVILEGPQFGIWAGFLPIKLDDWVNDASDFHLATAVRIAIGFRKFLKSFNPTICREENQHIPMVSENSPLFFLSPPKKNPPQTNAGTLPILLFNHLGIITSSFIPGTLKLA